MSIAPCPKRGFVRGYRCIDGRCVTYESDCKKSRSQCGGLNKIYCGKTNGDYCVDNDYECMRPCNSKTGVFEFEKRCTGYPGKCTWKFTWNCPKKCPYGTIRCPGNHRYSKCAKNLNWCKTCYSYRCQNTGKCISSSRKCDGNNDCGDRSDENDCSSGSDEIAPDSTAAVFIGVVVSVVLVSLIICIICCCRKKRGNRGAVLSGNQQRSTPSGPLVVGATPAASVPFVPPSNPYPSGPQNYQQQTGYPMTGFAPSVTGATPSAPLVDNNPTAAPPPSYIDVVHNEDQYQRKDPELPSYAMYTGSTNMCPPTAPDPSPT